MADFYCDISAIGNEYQAYADTPTTWGVPQDGNGMAGPGHSAAVAIATIDVAGCTASGTGTIGVLGVTVSSTLNASGSALATAIVSAINAATTAVSATYSALLLPLNRLVYARVNPVLNTQVQIMMRIAGADWVSFSPTQANISPAATIGNFAGGADGPFAYFATSATVFGKTQLGYGTFFAAAPGVTSPGANDVIHYRTKRSGTDLSIIFSSATGVTVSWVSRNHLFDDGTIWVGDNGKLLWDFRNTAGTAQSFLFSAATSATVCVGSRSKYNFEISVTISYVNSVVTLFYFGTNYVSYAFLNNILTESASTVGRNINLTHDGNVVRTAISIDLSGSYFIRRGTLQSVVNLGGSSSSLRIRAQDCIYEVVSATGTLGVPIYVGGTGVSGIIECFGGRVYDTLGVYSCPNVVAAFSSNISVVVDNVGGVTDQNISFNLSTIGQAKLWWSQAEGLGKGFRYVTQQCVTDWRNDGTFPYLNGQNPQGDFWSHRITWNWVPNIYSSATPLRLAHIYRDTTAVKTITLELYVPDATPIYLDEIEFSVSYVDPSSVPRTDFVGHARALQKSASRTALSASAAVWTANGVDAFSAKKIQLTTAYAVKQNSELSIRLSLGGYRSPTVVFYVNPEVSIA